MRWIQKVSVAGAVGIASSSLLIGMGGYDANIDSKPVELSSAGQTSDTTSPSEKQARFRQYQTTVLATTGGIAYLVAARLFKRVQPFRLYATAAALMLAIVPYNFFLLHRESGKGNQTGAIDKISQRKWELALVRTVLSTVAAGCALLAKGTA